MSCFWIGILNCLRLQTTDEYIKGIIKYLKTNNKKTINILWNNTPLTENNLDENYTSILQLNENDIHNGYLCSTFEPVLFLLCELFHINIVHNYRQTTITYTHLDKTVEYSTRNVKSDDHHFWC